MIIACLLSIMVNGEFEEHILTGEVFKSYPTYYVADFSNSAEAIHGQGNYKRFIVPDDRCSVMPYNPGKK